MFIIERIVSLFTFAGVLSIAMFGISTLKKPQYKVILWTYLICLVFFAYVYKPWITADLYRLHFWCENAWCQESWSGLWDYLRHSSTPMWYFFSWAIYQLTHDLNWIQTVACLLGFGCIIYVISDTIERNDVRGTKRAFILFFVMAIGTFYLEMISGIRSMLGLSIIFFCMYREIIQKKSILLDIPLYVFAAFMHPAALVLVTARILLFMFESKNVLYRLFCFPIVILIVVLSLYYANFYIDSAINKAIEYSTSENEYSYIWEIIIGLIEQLQLYFILYKYGKQEKKYSYDYNLFWKISLIIGIVSLCAMPFSYAIFRRYTIIASLCSIPLLGRLCSSLSPYSKKFFMQAMWLLSLIIFALSCIRGDLCGYKFFVLG